MKIKIYVYLFCGLLSLLASVTVANENPEIGVINKVITTEQHEIYLLSSTGVWKLVGNELIRERDKKVVSRHTIANTYLQRDPTTHFISIYLLVSLFIFALIYLFYQANLNKRRKAYYERIKVQQRVLSIAFLATGDEVLDCQIAENQVHKVNPNANLVSDSELYFKSESFLQKVHADDRSTFITKFESLLRGGRNNYELTYRIEKGVDEWIWISERGCVIERDEDGNAIRLISSMRDISSLKDEQEQLIRLVNELEKRLKSAKVVTS